MTNIQKKLIERARALSITQVELSKISRVRRATINAFLRDRKDIRLKTFLKLCEALGLEIVLRKAGEHDAP